MGGFSELSQEWICACTNKKCIGTRRLDSSSMFSLNTWPAWAFFLTAVNLNYSFKSKIMYWKSRFNGEQEHPSNWFVFETYKNARTVELKSIYVRVWRICYCFHQFVITCWQQTFTGNPIKLVKCLKTLWQVHLLNHSSVSHKLLRFLSIDI